MKTDDLNRRLHEAIGHEQLDVVRELLAAGADPNAAHEGRTPLERARHKADIRIELIVAGAWSRGLIHALVWAVGTHRADLVKRLIEGQADVNVSTPLGTPIHAAAKDGDLEIVELLLAAEADPDMGNTLSVPVLVAIEGGHEEVALRLLEAGADPMGGRTPALVKAAAEGAPRVVQWLLEHDADVHAAAGHIVVNASVMNAQLAHSAKNLFSALEMLTDEGGPPPDAEARLRAMKEGTPARSERIVLEDAQALHVACRMGRVAIVRMLLEAGADSSAREGSGKQARELAEAGEHAEVLALLEELGGAVAPPSPDVRLLAAAAEGDLEQMRAALGDGASISARDDRKATRSRTPLLLAVGAGHEAAVELLLEAGADPNEGETPLKVNETQRAFLGPDFKGLPAGRLPLIEAAKVGHAGIVSRLLEAGAEVTGVDGTGADSLGVASYNGALDVVTRVLEAGASLGPRKGRRYEPLVAAIEQGHGAVVDALLDAGIDVSRRDSEGHGALLKAAMQANAPLLERLLDTGVDPHEVDEVGNNALIHVLEASHWVSDAPADAPGVRMVSLGDEALESRSLEPCPPEQILAALEVLLGRGVALRAGDGEESVLSSAIQSGHVPVVERLIAAGAKVTDEDFRLARLFDHEEIVQLLGQHGTPPPLDDDDEYSDDYDDDDEYADGDDEDDEDDEGDEGDEDDEDEQWGPELHQPYLASAAAVPAYRAAVDELAKRCGSRPVPCSAVEGHYEIHVRKRLESSIDIEALQAEGRKHGAFVYRSKWMDNKLHVLPTTSLRDVIAAEQTNGANYGVGPGYIAQWLQALAAKHPYVITEVSKDTVAGRFLKPIDDPKALAESMYELCPDVIDQGFEQMERLVEHLATERSFHLWWD